MEGKLTLFREAFSVDGASNVTNGPIDASHSYSLPGGRWASKRHEEN